LNFEPINLEKIQKVSPAAFLVFDPTQLVSPDHFPWKFSQLAQAS
jgi:hypothetical protein